MSGETAQLGFDALLENAHADNEARRVERETAHLPATMIDALPFYRDLIDRHHAAMLLADVDEAMRLREEARLLATRLNGGRPGICADENAPGCVLARETAAASGAEPLWGQQGSFLIEAAGTRARIEMDGLFGIGSGFSFWMGFAAHAVAQDKPFISETGLSCATACIRRKKPSLFWSRLFVPSRSRAISSSTRSQARARPALPPRSMVAAMSASSWSRTTAILPSSGLQVSAGRQTDRARRSRSALKPPVLAVRRFLDAPQLHIKVHIAPKLGKLFGLA